MIITPDLKTKLTETIDTLVGFHPVIHNHDFISLRESDGSKIRADLETTHLALRIVLQRGLSHLSFSQRLRVYSDTLVALRDPFKSRRITDIYTHLKDLDSKTNNYSGLLGIFVRELRLTRIGMNDIELITPRMLGGLADQAPVAHFTNVMEGQPHYSWVTSVDLDKQQLHLADREFTQVLSPDDIFVDEPTGKKVEGDFKQMLAATLPSFLLKILEKHKRSLGLMA